MIQKFLLAVERMIQQVMLTKIDLIGCKDVRHSWELFQLAAKM